MRVRVPPDFMFVLTSSRAHEKLNRVGVEPTYAAKRVFRGRDEASKLPIQKDP